MPNDTLPLPTGPRPDADRLAWLLSGMPKVGRLSVDIHVFDALRAEVNALREAMEEALDRLDANDFDLAREAIDAALGREP